MAYSGVAKGESKMNVVNWTGNAAVRSITGVGFKPDIVWTKTTAYTTDWQCFNIPQGANKRLKLNESDAQATYTDALTSFETDGFNLGANADINANGNTYYGWCFKGAGTASANSDGSAANVTVSADTTAGISVVKFDIGQSATTIGHGLGVAPKVIIMKEITGSSNWITGGFGMDWNGYYLFNTNADFYNSGDANTGSGRMFKAGGTEPTTTVWHSNGSAWLSGSTQTAIAYCFAEKPGFSSFGNYKGNGGSDGAFVYTGFRPKMVICKKSSGDDAWNLYDDTRSASGGTNLNSYYIKPNESSAQGTSTSASIDIVSNGFKLRGNDGGMNGTGATYIYMAFAKSPFVANVGSNGIPTTAF